MRQELIGCSAPKVHAQRERSASLKRTSCHCVPPVFMARRRRMPSDKESTRAPFRSASMVSAECWDVV